MAEFTLEHGLLEGAEVYEPRGGGNPRQPPDGRAGVEADGLSRGLPLVFPDKASKLDTVGSAFTAFGLSYPLQAALLLAMGCDGDDSIDALAAAPQEEVSELIKGVVVVGKQVAHQPSLRREPCIVSLRSCGLPSMIRRLLHHQQHLHLSPSWSRCQTPRTSCPTRTTWTRRVLDPARSFPLQS